MTGGVSIEYAHARVSARLGQRPDERLWQQLRARRRVGALLDAVRSSPAAPYVSGIDPRATPEGIELAFRQQFRLRVDEAAQWAPDAWVAAVRWTKPLIDLPALVHLASDPALPAWLRVDPETAPYALPTLAERHAALAAGPLSPIAAALSEADPDTARPHTPKRLHRALDAWERHWRSLWPATSADEHANLDALARLLVRHEQDFGSLAVDEAANARLVLAARLSSLMRRAAAQPAALFAWLALLALDLERLRAEFLARALDETGVL
ncbi:MAG: hypothetical protein WBC37_16405 [Burkholderiaceae bacterium]